MDSNSTWGDWVQELSNEQPLLIAGPCSAETEAQVMATAHGLQATPARIFRAGIWKPRTRPGGFEGLGEIGLPWLQRVKAETGLLTAVEVANATHVKLALAHDVDVLWIGARTTVNPFAVQEIADVLQNTDKIVLVKNPVNPDLALWIGAIERLAQAGIKKMGAVHRGFSTYDKSRYRNLPEWQIAIELQRKFPELPLFCDPSHIAGRRDLLQEVAQQALDLNYQGLMIETHCTPDEAWSDAAQQITPERLVELWADLRIPKKTDSAEAYQAALRNLRLHIDAYDVKLLDILGNRMQIASEIGVLKKENNVAVLQQDRWNALLEKMIQAGNEKDLSQEFILRIFKAIHQESIHHQEQVIYNPEL
ncbi:MAG: bifunctional 3-deoxy-7-phosphoheptulonate synthase/chorismate mutase type II [Flavobacterium sp.]|nr:bifunctional 3-deoxy-7-phosphoheptulonate synthase/chorismate mutase type II [Flavobacterium sp.]